MLKELKENKEENSLSGKCKKFFKEFFMTDKEKEMMMDEELERQEIFEDFFCTYGTNNYMIEDPITHEIEFCPLPSKWTLNPYICEGLWNFISYWNSEVKMKI